MREATARSGRADYEFLDSGGGRRLERFGGAVVDRPAPGARHHPGLPPETWNGSTLRFDSGPGWRGEAPADWSVRLGGARLALRPASGGQVGVFPEHAALCGRLERLVPDAFPGGGVRALNLFAYTGLATLRLAALPGVSETVHVDAARSAVKRARENAVLSGMGNARIRWIADDAMAFAEREMRRNRRYEVFVADPPSFGRDRKTGKEWKFAEDFGRLLDAVGALAADGAVMLISTHTEGWTGDRLREETLRCIPRVAEIETGPASLESACGGRPAVLGAFALCGL